MKNAGLSLDQFERMYRRWEERRGLPPGTLDSKALKSVLNYLDQQSPFAMTEQQGKVILRLSVLRNSQPTEHMAIVADKDGEVWGVGNYRTRRKRRSFLELRAKGFTYGLPDELKMPISRPEQSYKKFFDPDSWGPTVFLGARMMHNRLIEVKAAPEQRHGRRAPNTHFDHAELHASLITFMTKVEKRRRILAVKAFTDRLDPDVFRMSEDIDRGNSETYNWLIAKSNRRSVAWRRQVAVNNPFLVMLASSQGARLGLESEYARSCGKRVTAAIDSGASLPNVVSDALLPDPSYPFRKAVVRMVMKMRPDDLPEKVREKFYTYVQYLGLVNPNWYPRTLQAWTDYHDCIATFIKFREFTPSRKMEDLVIETGGRWAEYAALIKEHGRLEDLHDWENFVRKKVMQPRLLAEGHTQSGNSMGILKRDAFYAGLRFADVLQTSIRWHNERGEINRKLSSLGVNAEGKVYKISWLPIDKEKTAPNGILCRPLTTPEALQRQHEAQAHCVDGYSSNCLYGHSHIISLEREIVLTTVELKEEWDKANKAVKAVKIAQHQGYKRRAPFADEVEAIDWYVASLKPDWDAIVHAREVAKTNMDRNSRILDYGYDPYDETSRRAAFEICRPYFASAEQRGLGYDGWFSEVLGIAPKNVLLLPQTTQPVQPQQARRFG